MSAARRGEARSSRRGGGGGGGGGFGSGGDRYGRHGRGDGARARARGGPGSRPCALAVPPPPPLTRLPRGGVDGMLRETPGPPRGRRSGRRFPFSSAMARSARRRLARPARGFCFPRSPQVRGAPCRPATPPAGRGEGTWPSRSPASPRITERPAASAGPARWACRPGRRPHLPVPDPPAPGGQVTGGDRGQTEEGEAN